ncbi:hypothetical protein RLOC_00011536 [Lonchura striata]|uniref:Uncharacterized protein n=1 Tax=Lonchura striata TaxID=40157 RepID=A0A218UKF1_9PASE|nr:hypothetical protein RLOC_00011536 [Lonchura striata domestica]
MAGVEKHV